MATFIDKTNANSNISLVNKTKSSHSLWRSHIKWRSHVLWRGGGLYSISMSDKTNANSNQQFTDKSVS